MDEIQRDLTRTVLAVLFIVGLIGAAVWILRPFLAAIVWATMITVATWPVMLALDAWLWPSRSLAVAVMTVALLSVVIVPLTLAVAAIVGRADEIAAWARSLQTVKVPPPPGFVSGLPFAGGRIAQVWDKVAAAELEDLASRAAPYAATAATWFIAQVGGAGLVVVEFLLTVVIAAIMYANGERVASGLRRFARRLAGAQGEDAVRLAGQAIRGVALGVVVTALLQAALGGIGLAIAGVPFAAVLTAVMFILAVAQIGVWPVLVPAIVWVYWRGASGWGTFLLLWAVVVLTMDNFVRPLLIKRGADLPLLLIFAGVNRGPDVAGPHRHLCRSRPPGRGLHAARGVGQPGGREIVRSPWPWRRWLRRRRTGPPSAWRKFLPVEKPDLLHGRGFLPEHHHGAQAVGEEGGAVLHVAGA
jgi:predicted PurR-regulated permease PerM